MQQRKLTADDICRYRDDGLLVVRGWFGEEQLQRATDAVLRGVRRKDALTSGKPYPSPQTQYSLQRNHVEDPDLASISADSAVVRAAETLLGGDAVMSAFVCYLKTPGAGGTSGDYGGSHPTAHQDYKTYQQAGSSLNWLFTIIPLVDLDEPTGPLYVSPGSYKMTRTERAGPIHRVRRSRGDEIAPLVDAKLRRGDLLFMHMWTWHEGGSNRSDRDRLGIYNKFRAGHAPPACGPELFSEKAHAMVTCENRPLLPHHGDKPLNGARLLLQHGDKFLLMRNSDGTPRWGAPGGGVHEGDRSRRFDRCNLIDSLEINVHEQLGVEVPWMTYLGDRDRGDSICRVYAHPLDQMPTINAAEQIETRWCTRQEVVELQSQDDLAGGFEADMIDLWMDDSFTRGVGESKRRAAPGRGEP